MAIPLAFLSRIAIPLVVATLFLGDVDISEQIRVFDKTQRLSDEVLSKARGEGEDGPETFDYIIVGAGSAGAVLANRLTASGESRVLLLEAGGDPNPIIDIPMAQKYYWDSAMDWQYSTVKQERSCHTSDGFCIWPRGKALGGSSSVNGLVYNRCRPKDYDLWANFTGDQTWSWANIRNTFNSLEDYHGFYEESAGPNHGQGGEMFVGKIDHIPGVEVFEEALAEKGIPVGDLNSGEFNYGFGKVDYNIKDGMRVGAYQAFLEPILNRTNLVIYRYAYAQKIEIISLGELAHVASGVTYERHGAIRTALATQEVIVAGGAVESPKLLMLSGVGPKEHLDELNIPTLVNLPVGKYLHEHPGLDVVGDKGGFFLNTTFGVEYNTTGALLQFLQDGTGPMNGFAYESGYSPQIMMGYLKSKSNPELDWPEVHLYIHEQYTSPPMESEQMYFAVELVRPNSFGTIKLASTNPEEKPLIDPSFFEDMNDVEILVDVIEEMMDLFLNSNTFQKYGIQNLDVFTPCAGEEFQSRDYWRCLVQQRSMPFFHPTSTCRMGPNSTVAVVDSKLKVFGIQNLRVVDASVMPFVPSGNTNLPAMLIGARAAEMILSGE